jgi:NADH dehydrogenase FAD-containing subunit
MFARGNPDQAMPIIQHDGQSTCTTSPASCAQARKAAQNAARKARVKAAKARKRRSLACLHSAGTWTTIGVMWGRGVMMSFDALS